MLINIHFRNQWNESMGYPPCDISPIKTPTPIFQEEEEREKSKASIRVARFEKRSTINGQATCRSTVVHCGLMSRVDIVAATLQRGARRSRDREAQNRRFHSPRQQWSRPLEKKKSRPEETMGQETSGENTGRTQITRFPVRERRLMERFRAGFGISINAKDRQCLQLELLPQVFVTKKKKKKLSMKTKDTRRL